MKAIIRTYCKGTGRFYLLVSLALIAIQGIATGQKVSKRTEREVADTVALIREFVSVSNGYKKMPMYLNMEIAGRTNFITDAVDTMNITGEFFLRDEQSYVHFGEFEQLINDSIALLVSKNLRQMIIYKNPRPVVTYMKRMMGMEFPDSSLINMARLYKVTKYMDENNHDNEIIRLESRSRLPEADMLRETIELKFNRSNRMLINVINTKKSLLRISDEQYNDFSNKSAMKPYLFDVKGSYWIVKENITEYTYKKIEYGETVRVPVSCKDRIVLNEQSEYIPATGYADYGVKINN